MARFMVNGCVGLVILWLGCNKIGDAVAEVQRFIPFPFVHDKNLSLNKTAYTNASSSGMFAGLCHFADFPNLLLKPLCRGPIKIVR